MSQLVVIVNRLYVPTRSSPCLGWLNMELMETKKAWEILTSAHPYIQAFALPLPKDKQRKSAHAE